MNRLSKFRLCGNVDGTISSKLLYLLLLELCDENGEVVISQRTISRSLHISKHTVSRNLRRLRERGYIDTLVQHHSDGGRAANKYRIK